MPSARLLVGAFMVYSEKIMRGGVKSVYYNNKNIIYHNLMQNSIIFSFIIDKKGTSDIIKVGVVGLHTVRRQAPLGLQRRAYDAAVKISKIPFTLCLLHYL